MPRVSSRFAATPDALPPSLRCPTCDRDLVHRETVLTDVKPLERWDYFECRRCGRFQYRERTRELRPTNDLPLRVSRLP